MNIRLFVSRSYLISLTIPVLAIDLNFEAKV